MRKYFRFLFALFLCISLITPSTFAATSQEDPSVSIIELENGDYIEVVTTITRSSNRASMSETAATRTFTYTSLGGDKMFAYILYGEFEYNGVTSSATYVDYGIEIYRSGWDVDSHSEYISGNSVRGSATFNGPFAVTRTLSGGITCDKNGKII